MNGTFDRYTLGVFEKLMKAPAGRQALESPFREHGLSYEDVFQAVSRVNAEADAKHHAVKKKNDAEAFRARFLASPSIFACLLSNGNDST